MNIYEMLRFLKISKQDRIEGKGLSDNNFSNNEKQKVEDSISSTAAASAISTAQSSVQGNLNSHVSNIENPHEVTKTQVGLSNVDNTSDANKPVSNSQLTSISASQTAVQNNLNSHTNNSSNPHSTTKSQVGLASVDNTSDTDKPVSTAQNTAISAVQTNLTTHANNVANPHGTTKTQVGLSNVDNVSDTNKPVSTLQAAADANVLATAKLYSDQGIAALVNSSPAALDTLSELATSLANDPNFATTMATALGNRVRVDADSQGLSGTQKTNAKTNLDLQNVTNTSDANKPVSTAQQAALDLKADKTITISPGYGLTGGGSLSANRILDIVLSLLRISQTSTYATTSSATTPSGFSHVTPVAGTYLIFCTARVEVVTDNSAGYAQLYVGGVAVTGTLRTYGGVGTGGGGLGGTNAAVRINQTMSIIDSAVLSGSQNVEVKFAHSQGNFNVFDRGLILLRVA